MSFTIHNPVLPGFHPDPSFLRVGDDYYIANSSFEWFPGVPIHHSRDLVHWRLIGHALTRRNQLDLLGVGDSAGVWAPSMSHHDGTFYLVYTTVRTRVGPFKDVQIFLVTAPGITGPWLHPSDSDQRLVYSLAATFLGRMCISGDVVGLSDAQSEQVRRAQDLYRRCAHVIKHGVSRRFGEIAPSWRQPQGWQVVVRTAVDAQAAVVVVHTFAACPQRVQVPLEGGDDWSIASELLARDSPPCELVASGIQCPVSDFNARVLLLARKKRVP